MDPDHDRVWSLTLGCKHVQVQTVLGSISRHACLGAITAVTVSIPHSAPAFCRLGRSEAQFPDWGCRVGDSQVLPVAFLLDPTQLAGGGGTQQGVRCRLRRAATGARQTTRECCGNNDGCSQRKS